MADRSLRLEDPQIFRSVESFFGSPKSTVAVVESILQAEDPLAAAVDVSEFVQALIPKCMPSRTHSFHAQLVRRCYGPSFS